MFKEKCIRSPRTPHAQRRTRPSLQAIFRTGLAALLKKLRGGSLSLAEYHALNARVHFALCTPKVALFLHLSGLVPAGDWLRFLIEDTLHQAGHGIRDLLELAPADAVILRALLVHADAFERSLQQSDKPAALAAPRVRDWLLQQLDGSSVFQTTFALSELMRHGFDQDLSALQVRVQDYDWFADASSPLHSGPAFEVWLDYLQRHVSKSEFEDILVQGLCDVVLQSPEHPEAEPAFPIFRAKLISQGIDEASIQTIIHQAQN